MVDITRYYLACPVLHIIWLCIQAYKYLSIWLSGGRQKQARKHSFKQHFCAFCQQLFVVCQALCCLWLKAYQLPRWCWCNRSEMARYLARANSVSNVTRSEPSSSCSPCSAWVTLLRGWLLCCWFEPKEERGEGRKLYCYTGNTKVPIRTSNSQRLMKYKWYRGK